MKFLRLSLCVLVFGVAFAIYRGDDWRFACFGGLVGCLVGAMLETAPLLDWIYPPEDSRKDSAE